MSVPPWAYGVAYAAGFLVTLLVAALVDRWPFAKPRADELYAIVTFFVALLWPAVIVGWALHVWEITHEKDHLMLNLVDDRVVQVEPNTGRILGRMPPELAKYWEDR